jgi:hypothetical protein
MAYIIKNIVPAAVGGLSSLFVLNYFHEETMKYKIKELENKKNYEIKQLENKKNSEIKELENKLNNTIKEKDAEIDSCELFTLVTLTTMVYLVTTTTMSSLAKNR